METLTLLGAGLLTGLGLIIAIGAQNAYVLRVGVAAPRGTVLAIVAVCAISDAVLIAAGIAGIGALIATAGWVIEVARWLGAVFLIGYGLRAAWRVGRPEVMPTDEDGEAAPPVPSRRTAVLAVMAFTWLNPHVYLDTVILLGSIANQHPSPDRWIWGAGAMVASILWFVALGFGARFLRPLLRRPVAWRVLDALIAVVMLALGARLALGF